MRSKNAAPLGGIAPVFPVDEMLQVAVEHQRDALLITEADRIHPDGRRIVYVNPAFTAMTGFTADEAIGRTPDITVGEKTDREAIRKIQAGIQSKSPLRQEILKYRKDGTTLWVELDIAPVVEPNGRCRYFICVMRDITEKRRDHEELARQGLEIEHASRLKSEFLANVSHELRTPLAAVVSYSSALLAGVYGSLSEPQRKAMQRLDSNCHHLVGLINEVLDLSRIESGGMPVHLETFALDDMVRELVAELEPIILRSQLSVTVALMPGMTPIRSDRQKVRQILLNLFSNAIKFTREGWVRISATQAGTSTSISVSDSGIGIAADDQGRVFDAFWQADPSPLRAQAGSGLGLSISQRLAKLLGGAITLESALGQGAAFTFTLPTPPAL